MRGQRAQRLEPDGRYKKPQLVEPLAPRHFVCLCCGNDVFRPEADRFDDNFCLNCWYGRARVLEAAEP